MKTVFQHVSAIAFVLFQMLWKHREPGWNRFAFASGLASPGSEEKRDPRHRAIRNSQWMCFFYGPK